MVRMKAPRDRNTRPGTNPQRTMQTSDRIVVTGAAGFIGSCLVQQLNASGYHRLILVDDFSVAEKSENLAHKRYEEKIERDAFESWWADSAPKIDFVFHLGARTDTTTRDLEVLNRLNLEYSRFIWSTCSKLQIPLIYASSAATYGDGQFGYKDDHQLPERLLPLNPYGISKNEFDKWALKQATRPPFWSGLKFFNVFGPNECHKGRMASVVFHAFRQIRETGRVRLFRSHHPDFSNGGQLRDFIYVMDVVKVLIWLAEKQPDSGLYNLGTGRARTFSDLAKAVFASLDLEPEIAFIDTPEDIRANYQYFTEADMRKLQQAGYDTGSFYSLETAVDEYVRKFLLPGAHF